MSTDVDVDALLEASFSNFANGGKSTNSNESGSTSSNGSTSAQSIEKEKKRDSRDRDGGKRDYRDRDRDYRDNRDNRDRDYRDNRDSRGGDRDYRDKRDYRDNRDRDRDYRDRDYDSRDRRGGGGGGGYNNRDRDYDDRRSYGGGNRGRYDRPYERRDRPLPPPEPVLPELTPEEEEEMDLRTAFIQNLSPKVHESDLYDFFAQAGKVVKVSLVVDRITRKLKGVGYVEFKEKDMVDEAVKLTGQKVLGHTIAVHRVQPEKKSTATTIIGATTAMDATSLMATNADPTTLKNNTTSTVAHNSRLYVGFLNLGMTEEQIRALFVPYGEVDFINVHIKPGIYKYAFVQFRTSEAAARAHADLNGKDLLGKPLKITFVSEDKINSGGVRKQQQQHVIGIAGVNPLIPINPHILQAGMQFQQQQMYQPMGSLDDEEGSAPLSAQAKIALTAKLQGLPVPGSAAAAAATTTPPPPGTGLLGAMPYGMTIQQQQLHMLQQQQQQLQQQQQMLQQQLQQSLTTPTGSAAAAVGSSPAVVEVVAVVAPSPCMVLKNMFDPDSETGDEWPQEIQKDVEEECTNFGNIKHIFLDRYSQGYIYLKYDNSDMAALAISKLNRRWFSSKMLSAEFIPETIYYQKFPEALSK
ncbi:putative RNA splicing factor [Cavenderia fasciculata]|uniref:RNA splicing factor n=1 Tax=Cavenderia fasciculata TaxID=261658 RepID=F4QAS4_CACFS|nr:putative RNA splicing factor [Cavenderia fasciculata]EGG14992.1 putative RNA splicing factor [Cavenderia fasciculata]|eukprot:XP_004351712.1 putative RNA splicing factor [Cavenderia fasciculata]